MDKKAILKGLAASLKKTQAAFDLGPKILSKSYGKGKWTGREILAHLTDCELVFVARLKFLLSEDRPSIVPFDQEAWEKRGNYKKTNLKNAKVAFSVLRGEFIAMLKTAKESDLARRGRHPENPTYNIRYLAEHSVEHNDRHLEQLAAIKAGKSWSAPE